MWQVTVPNEGLKHAYLMSSILAVSALHLAHTSTLNNESYRNAATQHQDIALRSFRPHLEEITADNCDALSASSVLTVIFGAALYVVPAVSGSARATPLEAVLQVCELVRGVNVINNASERWIRTGILAPLWKRPPRDVVEELPQDTSAALQAVQEWITTSLKDRETQSAYLIPLELLQRTFEITLFTRHPAVVFRWLVVVSRDFIGLLQKKDPLALVLLAHYGVALHELRQDWWSGNWGVDLVHYVHGILDDEWRLYVEWPMRRVGMEETSG